MALIIEDFERSHLIPSIVAKDRSNFGFDEGIKALELLKLKVNHDPILVICFQFILSTLMNVIFYSQTLSVAQDLSLQKMDESHKMVDLVKAIEQREKMISGLQAERELLLKEREDTKSKAIVLEMNCVLPKIRLRTPSLISSVNTKSLRPSLLRLRTGHGEV